MYDYKTFLHYKMWWSFDDKTSEESTSRYEPHMTINSRRHLWHKNEAVKLLIYRRSQEYFSFFPVVFFSLYTALHSINNTLRYWDLCIWWCDYTSTLLILPARLIRFLIGFQIVLYHNAPIFCITVQVSQIAVIGVEIQNTCYLRLTACLHKTTTFWICTIKVTIAVTIISTCTSRLEREIQKIRVLHGVRYPLGFNQSLTLIIRQFRVGSPIVRIDPSIRIETGTDFGLDISAGVLRECDGHLARCMFPCGRSRAYAICIPTSTATAEGGKKTK